MNFELTDERQMLQDSLRRYLSDTVTPELLHKATEAGSGGERLPRSSTSSGWGATRRAIGYCPIIPRVCSRVVRMASMHSSWGSPSSRHWP